MEKRVLVSHVNVVINVYGEVRMRKFSGRGHVLIKIIIRFTVRLIREAD